MDDATGSMAQRLLRVPFASVLYQLRDARGWSQQDVAERLEVSVNTVSRWERGEIVRPDPIHRRGLAEMFGVTVEQLGLTRPHPAGQGAEQGPLDAGATTGAMQETYDLPELVAVPDDLENITNAQHAWRTVRQALNRHRFQLTDVACQLYGGTRIGPRLLTSPRWLPSIPLPLDEVDIAWVGHPSSAEVTGTEPAATMMLPAWTSGRRYERYVHALRDLDPPRLLENRLSYRLLDLSLQPGDARLTFGPTTYFELVDLAEALAHELAATHLVPERGGRAVLRPASWRRLPLRRLVDSPFELHRRAVPCSVNTLTVRRDRQGAASIILHQRDARRVAVCGGMYHVMPAAVFQPCSMAAVPVATNGDLWRNILREYAEEFLGDLTCDGNATKVLDYDGREPFRTLQRAQRNGLLHAWVLGAGLDPLTLWGELLTAVVIDVDVFDVVFRDLVPANQEGVVVRVAGRDAHGVAFNHEHVEQLRHANMAPAATACLDLAWQHRHFLLRD